MKTVFVLAFLGSVLAFKPCTLPDTSQLNEVNAYSRCVVEMIIGPQAIQEVLNSTTDGKEMARDMRSKIYQGMKSLEEMPVTNGIKRALRALKMTYLGMQLVLTKDDDLLEIYTE